MTLHLLYDTQSYPHQPKGLLAMIRRFFYGLLALVGIASPHEPSFSRPVTVIMPKTHQPGLGKGRLSTKRERSRTWWRRRKARMVMARESRRANRG